MKQSEICVRHNGANRTLRGLLWKDVYPRLEFCYHLVASRTSVLWALDIKLGIGKLCYVVTNIINNSADEATARSSPQTLASSAQTSDSVAPLYP